jgi:hypothetical protein
VFRQIVNYNLQLIVQQVQETQSITLQIPGVPEYSITTPDYYISPTDPYRFDIIGERPQLDSAFIGGRFPYGAPYDRIRAIGQTAGNPGLLIKGGTLKFPGSDPLSNILTWINTNYQMIIEQVPSLQTVIDHVPITTYSPCQPQQPGADSQPPSGPTNDTTPIVTLINSTNDTILGGLGTNCDVFGGFDNAGGPWHEGGSLNAGDSTTVTDSTFSAERPTQGPGTTNASIDSDPIDSSDWTGCGDTLTITVTLVATIDSVGGGIPEVTASFWSNGSVLAVVDQVGVPGTQTDTVTITFAAPFVRDFSGQVFINGNCKGHGEVTIVDFSFS